MILRVLFYAELETFVLKMQIQLEKLGPPFENFWPATVIGYNSAT